MISFLFSMWQLHEWWQQAEGAGGRVRHRHPPQDQGCEEQRQHHEPAGVYCQVLYCQI